MLTDARKQGGRRNKTAGTFQRLGVIPLPKMQTHVHSRLIDTAALLGNEPPEVTFQHSIFCQTSLPYRDPGPDMRRWERSQGNVLLEIEAGRAVHPGQGRFVDVPLPYGPKARLILMHLNAEAVRTQSPRVDVGDSLTAFVKRLGIDTHGRNIKTIREQVTALSAATIRLGQIDGARARQVDTRIVGGFELWLPKDDNQRVLWPCFVELDPRYFESLQTHAVPLDERAIGALSHSAMALDIYAWLAQRLHRIPKASRQFIAWTAVKEQFGPDFARVRKFREKFMEALRQVHAVYPAATMHVNPRGLYLFPSPPPVAKTGVVVRLPAS